MTAGADVDTFNFTDETFRAFGYGLQSAWNTRWSTDGGVRIDQRAGQTAWRVTGSVARRLAPRMTATFGASAGPGRGIVSSREVSAGLGIGIPVTSNGLVRALELTHDQRWLGFAGASVVTARTSALVYLPREWLLSLAVTAARSDFSGLGSEWHPSSVVRVTLPLTGQMTGHAFWARGSENYALRDQIGHFRATTIGGGVRQELPRDQDLMVYVAWQRRTQGRAQTSLGLSHGIRF
jgi:YaiO family outer membrane protein